jgi:hypothetical protein
MRLPADQQHCDSSRGYLRTRARLRKDPTIVIRFLLGPASSNPLPWEFWYILERNFLHVIKIGLVFVVSPQHYEQYQQLVVTPPWLPHGLTNDTWNVEISPGGIDLPSAGVGRVVLVTPWWVWIWLFTFMTTGRVDFATESYVWHSSI